MENIMESINSLQLDDENQSQQQLLQLQDKSTTLSQYMVKVIRYIELGVPNLYCSHYFDDEDFIYTEFILPENITNYIANFGTFSEYVLHYIVHHKCIIDFSKKDDVIYGKTIYIYQFIENGYFDIARTDYINGEIFNWVTNLILCIKTYIDVNPKHSRYDDLSVYNRELLYGMNVIVCHVKMIIKHHQTSSLTIDKMDSLCRSKFLRILKNLCQILIYFKFTFGGD